MLSQRQTQLLLAVHSHIEANGVSPSFEELRVAIGAASRSNVMHLLDGIEGHGYISRRRGTKRAITVLRLPEGSPAEVSRQAILRLIDLATELRCTAEGVSYDGGAQRTVAAIMRDIGPAVDAARRAISGSAAA